MKKQILTNKVTVITGASSGIGKQLAIELAKSGAVVILCARNLQALKETQLSLKQPQNHYVYSLDITDKVAIDEFISHIKTQFNGIDMLFNCAGVSQRSKVIDTNFEVDRAIMEVNYFGAIQLTKALLPSFISKKSGCIVNIASVSGKIGVYERSAYSASKHALLGYMDSLRTEVDNLGVKVINICPGYVKTSLSKNALNGDLSTYEKLDDTKRNVMSANTCAAKILKCVVKNKPEAIIAKGLPWAAYHLKRLFPQIFLKYSHKMVKEK